MLLSSRASPPKPLRFGASASTSASDRYLSIRQFLPSTPIPSPSLPSILPRHGKKPPKLNSRKIVRGLFWLSCIIAIYYLVSFGRTKSHKLAELTFLTSLGKVYEIVEAAELPDHPTPLALTDAKGKHHWTISIPHELPFPLPYTDYADICSQVDEVARHVAGPRDKSHQSVYYHDDPNFIDVQEAQSQHFLPPEPYSPSHEKEHNLPVCEKSLTYVLDAADAGLGSTLLGLWLSYSLARREDRALFIDDTHFPYGQYSTFFASKPSPSCRLPGPSHRVPCPHQARHLVVSAATTSWIFGESFHNHFSQREIFDMAREGYEALFKLRPQDEQYVLSRVEKLRKDVDTSIATSSIPQDKDFDDDDDYWNDVPPENGLVGIHIRRGDRHPFSLTYSQNYIPPEIYMATALKLVGQSSQWKFLVASDDADMYDHIDLPNTLRAQERISLASKKKLASMGQGGGLGWEGGFFKDVFWGLGLPQDVKERKKWGSPMPMKAKHRFGEKDDDGREKRRDYRTHPTKEALQLRELLGRAYLLDLAMLAQSDKVICGVSANACRILAVMLGWERSFEKKDWNNVDGGYRWRALDY
ncbi:uncharacterized protein A1O5_00531 [Cladophialophora psammophila CBS 110553]|uniref:Uncharacterized protein n=1 Tax=Cladophialophora psammophila CBS 110553 TaxID=1182543 RepID=W9X737_9EURO|nr:uncharacterized protein A1O5_00531 [Cladophialophora psammophila CBS 110553]EXJ76023.1 hypothetical protein A1O5_00531 [Cladophialophora psammophila CBS 110553]